MDDTVAQTDFGDGLRMSQTPREESFDFTKHVASYFGAYIDGTLSTGGRPLRAYGDAYADGLATRVTLERYPQLNKNIYKNFVTGLGQQTFVVAQNKYTYQPDDRVLFAARENASKVTIAELAPLYRKLAAQAKAKLLEPTASQKDIVEELLVSARLAIEYEFVVPFILPFHTINIDARKDERARYALRQLRDAVVSRLWDASRETLRQTYYAYLASEEYVSKDSLMTTLTESLSVEQIKDSLDSCIDDQYIGDAYQQIYALHRNSKITNKELILYFGELRYDDEVYPLFYTRVISRHALPSVTLTFDNHIHVNKQAIEYVVRQFATRMNQQVDMVALNVPTVVRNAEEIDSLQQLIARLSAVCKINGTITLSKTALQEATNGIVSLTNRIYLLADDPSVSAIAGDYVEIVRNNVLHKSTRQYIESLLQKPGGKHTDEIRETWKEKDYFDKLLPVLPVAVNDEQKQVLMALGKTSADRIVVNAAESTGKRHLVKASVLKALTKGQKVLVVGSESTFGATLRQEIGDSLIEASGRAGHNPVFDLADRDALEHVDDQAVSDATASVSLVESKLSELSVAKKRKKQALKDSYTQFVQNAENINLHEIEQSLSNERRFADKDWIQDEPVDGISTAMQKLHRSIQYVRSSDAGYLMSYVEVNQQKSIEDFIAAYKEYEAASRSVRSRLPKFIVRYRKLLPDQKKHLQESLAYIQSNYRQFLRILRDDRASEWLGISENTPFQEVIEQSAVFNKVFAIAQNADKLFKYGNKTTLLHEMDSYVAEPQEIIEALDTYIEQVATLKSKLFGFSGRMLVVENLNKQLVKSLPSFGLPEPERQSESMQVMSDFVRYTTEELAAAGMPIRYWKNIVHLLLATDNQIEDIEQILASFGRAARFDFVYPYKIHEADNLLANITLLEYATELNRVYREFPKLSKLIGLSAVNHLLVRPHEFTARIAKLGRDLTEATKLNDAKKTIKNFVDEYPEASKRLGIRFNGGNFEVVDDTFANTDGEYVDEYLQHKRKEQDVRAYFDDVVVDSFGNTSIEYRQILGVELQHELNTLLLQFIKEQSAYVSGLSAALKERRKLQVAEVARLVKPFPCIAGTAQQVSTLLPIEANMFDLVIIDDADALTIAESLPLTLRAKKVLVVGDSAQSNTRETSQQHSISELYATRATAALRNELGSTAVDSKNAIINKQEQTFRPEMSALDFFTVYANCEFSLSRQSGVYEELASFGNRHYYNNVPQSLVSRTIPLADVIKFSRVKSTKDQVTRFTNTTEVDHIIEQLQQLKDQGFSGTIAIVTPFAEQAALIQKELDECVITDWFERRNVRVVTFDGKYRNTADYTYYSLVASEQFNEISQVLPSSIGFDAFAGDKRSHRLLTGFSGNRQTVHIVHSLGLDEYQGALGETLKHYNAKLRGSVVVKGGATDVLQAAETNIGRAFEKTNFAKKYEERLSFISKYPFVNYIKVFSPNYYKAQYKMYFLAMIDARPIVIEFDDFRERFLQNSKDDDNEYLTQQDIYGYKQLEEYGYRFLRLNRFTIGADPARTLDSYLGDLVKTPTWPADNGFVA